MKLALRQVNGVLYFISPSIDTALLEIINCSKDSTNIELIMHDNKYDKLYVKFNNSSIWCYTDITGGDFEIIKANIKCKFTVGLTIHGIIKNRPYSNNFSNIIDFKIADPNEIVKLVNDLVHHYDNTVGLYATDRPDLVKDKRGILFKITAFLDE